MFGRFAKSRLVIAKLCDPWGWVWSVHGRRGHSETPRTLGKQFPWLGEYAPIAGCGARVPRSQDHAFQMANSFPWVFLSWPSMRFLGVCVSHWKLGWGRWPRLVVVERESGIILMVLDHGNGVSLPFVSDPACDYPHPQRSLGIILLLSPCAMGAKPLVADVPILLQLKTAR